MGVTVTRSAMLSHCRALTAACSYTEGEVIVCVLDFKVSYTQPTSLIMFHDLTDYASTNSCLLHHLFDENDHN